MIYFGIFHIHQLIVSNMVTLDKLEVGKIQTIKVKVIKNIIFQE